MPSRNSIVKMLTQLGFISFKFVQTNSVCLSFTDRPSIVSASERSKALRMPLARDEVSSEGIYSHIAYPFLQRDFIAIATLTANLFYARCYDTKY